MVRVHTLRMKSSAGQPRRAPRLGDDVRNGAGELPLSLMNMRLATGQNKSASSRLGKRTLDMEQLMRSTYRGLQLVPVKSDEGHSVHHRARARGGS